MRALYLCLGLFSLSFLQACRAQIGDSCTDSYHCSQSENRFCDLTQPAGYCTIPDCFSGSCPQEATCIAYGARVSPIPGCDDQSGTSRFQRTYCMLSCDEDSDCRDGYRCINMGDPNNPWGAVVLDSARSPRVCAIAPTGKLPENSSNGVCTAAENKSLVQP